MTAPSEMYTVSFPTGEPQKVHHSYVWLNSLVAIGAVVIISTISSIDGFVQIALLARDAGMSLGLIILGAIGLFILLYGIMVGTSVLAWRNMWFVFDEKEFSFYSGIITKRQVHVPYARVQSVNHRQSLVQRLAGVCTVVIDTAGGASNKAVKVPYVLLGTGEAIRQDLFIRKAAAAAHITPVYGNYQPSASTAGAPVPPTSSVPGAPVAPAAPAAPSVPSMPRGSADAPTPAAAGAPVPPGATMGAEGLAATNMRPAQGAGNILDDASAELGINSFRGVFESQIPGMEPIQYERRLSNSELGLASISHSGVLAAAISVLILAALMAVTTAFFDPRLLGIGILSTPLLALIFVAAVALSAAATALTFGNFSVRRRGSRIEVEKGILHRDFSGIDIERIQTIIVSQSLVRRMLGYCEVSLGRIGAVADGNEQSNTAKLYSGALVVHPFCKMGEIDALLAGLLPEFADRPSQVNLKKLPRVALRRGLLRRCLWRNGLFWATVCIAIAQIALNTAFAELGQISLPMGTNLLAAANIACVVWYLVFVLEVALIALGTVWWKRGSGFAFNHKYMIICNDGLETEIVWLPRSKVQDAFTRTNPFQRIAGTTTIGATTAAGGMHTAITLWDVTEADGQAWTQWLVPRTSSTPM